MTADRFARAEIDLDAVAHNVRVLKSLTSSGTLFMAVVKADGYGHGAAPVARTALGAGADRLGVATVAEAHELREAGIRAPIQILSEPPHEAIPSLLAEEIIPTVTTREFVVALGREASALGVEARYHLKVDTGMNRIGVPADEAADFALALRDYPGLEMEGIFTHFATADVPGDWDFEQQKERFSAVLARMKVDGVDPGIAHAANSAATILHPETHAGMVRCGIAIYGLHPDASTYGKVDLRPAMAIKAQVSLVKQIGMGDGVSYGFTWRAAGPATVATLPLGYGDGVHRVLSNSMEVLIDGTRCRQVGRVCMDQLVVEVPAGMDVSYAQEAVLVGSQGSETIIMDEMAQKAGTINYEMACGFGLRLPRVYV